jgi:hypothetical protein
MAYITADICLDYAQSDFITHLDASPLLFEHINKLRPCQSAQDGSLSGFNEAPSGVKTKRCITGVGGRHQCLSNAMSNRI